MKAIVCNEYGPPDVLRIEEVGKPFPKENEVLVRVRAVSVNFGDLMARNFRNITPGKFNMPLLLWVLARIGFGWKKPKVKILGNTFSGEVESVGINVSQFREGDKVFGYTGEKMGTYAEYLSVAGNGIIAIMPSNISLEEASAIPYGSVMALNLLRKINIRSGQKALIIGASGEIGSAAVQLLKNHYGAYVTGVCSGPNIEMVKALGADPVIDYTKEDLTKINDRYDLIIDILGRNSFSYYKSLLNTNGVCLYVSFKTAKIFQALWTLVKGGKKVVCALAIPKQRDLLFIKSLTEQGKIKPVIVRCFPLDQASMAHYYIESGKNRGGVVIKTDLSHTQV